MDTVKSLGIDPHPCRIGISLNGEKMVYSINCLGTTTLKK
jgi:hypothetical protein